MSFLSKFSFRDFRGFVGENDVEFAIPNGTTPGSGITYIVGENNSGKTSVLEAMAFRGIRSDGSNYYNSPGELRTSDARSNNVRFSFYDSDDSLVEDLALIRDGSFVLCDNADVGRDDQQPMFVDFNPLFVPARRYWSPKVNNSYYNGDVTMRYYDQGNVLRQMPDGQIMHQQIADVFYRVELDDELYKKYINTIRRIFPDFESFTVINEDAKSISYVMNGSPRHRADFLGDGVVSVMCIVAYLIAHDKCMLIIDEPELSLHPLAQKRFADVIADCARDRQIVVSTHSPYLVKWGFIKNGARLNRVVKTNDETRIYHLGVFSEYQSLIQGANWQQPFLADEVSREVFFYDKVLFVEGQDDVGLLRQDGALERDINIFGYGVRGFRNFPFALKLAHDVGIAKAGVLIDKGNDEDVMADELKRDYPEYLVCQWGRGDIRDKSGFCGLMPDDITPDIRKIHPSKEGYFTEKGEKKPLSQLGDYNEKISQINDYFSDR